MIPRNVIGCMNCGRLFQCEQSWSAHKPARRCVDPKKLEQLSVGRKIANRPVWQLVTDAAA